MVALHPGLDTRSSEVKLMLKWPLNERRTGGVLVPENLWLRAPASSSEEPLIIWIKHKAYQDSLPLYTIEIQPQSTDTKTES